MSIVCQPFRFAVPAAVLGILLLAGCSSHRHRFETPRPGFVERGMASWYGPKFDGKPTASGETFDMHALTAAHKELPLGTVADVRNLENGRTVRVRINDRGPFVRGRILDLSYAAARELGMVEAGLARVEIRIAAVGSGPPGPARTPFYTVQVGAFRDRDNALDLRRRLRSDGPPVVVEAGDDGLHRVRVGRFKKRAEAEKLRRRLRRRGFDAVLVGLRSALQESS